MRFDLRRTLLTHCIAWAWRGAPNRPVNVLGNEYTQTLTVSEGLLGSYLPIILYVFEVTARLRWEMAVVRVWQRATPPLAPPRCPMLGFKEKARTVN